MSVTTNLAIEWRPVWESETCRSCHRSDLLHGKWTFEGLRLYIESGLPQTPSPSRSTVTIKWTRRSGRSLSFSGSVSSRWQRLMTSAQRFLNSRKGSVEAGVAPTR